MITLYQTPKCKWITVTESRSVAAQGHGVGVEEGSKETEGTHGKSEDCWHVCHLNCGDDFIGMSQFTTLYTIFVVSCISTIPQLGSFKIKFLAKYF
jgi:hypothetical protein